MPCVYVCEYLSALAYGAVRIMRQFQHTLAMEGDVRWLSLGIGIKSE